VKLGPIELVSRLFGEAWEYRRSRHRAIAAGGLLAIAAVAAGLIVGHSQGAPTQRSTGGKYRVEPSSSVITSWSLSVGGSGAFQRVGVSLVLKDQATSVVASIDGQTADLRSLLPQDSSSTVFAGRFKIPNAFPPRAGVPAGHGGLVSVRLRILYTDGSRVSTSLSAHFKHGLALR
jgi:hypothetical protein